MKRRAGRCWQRDGGDDRFRYNYDLTANSIVFDCGAYLGEFAEKVSRRYGCRIYCFEPVQAYFQQLAARVEGSNRIVCLNYGVGAVSREASISVENAASSLLQTLDSSKRETVRIVDICQVLESLAVSKVDLLKLNIEGGEFEVLEAILDRDLQTRFRHLQVQFHQVVPSFHKRRLRIRDRLRKTHSLTYDYYFVWENWSLHGAGSLEPLNSGL